MCYRPAATTFVQNPLRKTSPSSASIVQLAKDWGGKARSWGQTFHQRHSSICENEIMGMGAGLGRAAGMPPATAGKEATTVAAAILGCRIARLPAGCSKPERFSRNWGVRLPRMQPTTPPSSVFACVCANCFVRCAKGSARIGRTKSPLADCANRCFAGAHERIV